MLRDLGIFIKRLLAGASVQFDRLSCDVICRQFASYENKAFLDKKKRLDQENPRNLLTLGRRKYVGE